MFKRAITIKSINGEPHTFEFPTPWGNDRKFIVGLHKAGSVLLNELVKEILSICGIPFLSIEEYLFSVGLEIEDIASSEIEMLDLAGYVYTGFRSLRLLKSLPSARESVVVLLVRDLRDVATSYYFSKAYSHAEPGGGESLQLFQAERRALRGSSPSLAVKSGMLDGLLETANEVAESIHRYQNVVLYRYEDVILRKRAWVEDLRDALGVNLSIEDCARIADKHDVIPSRTRRSSHIRHVRPGNHKEHLDSEAQAYILRKGRPFFLAFGYPDTSDTWPRFG